MASLTVSELFKYEWRVEVFLKKYKNSEPFEMKGGKKVTLVPDKEIISAVKSQNKAVINKIGLIDNKGNKYPFGHLEKTKEFGGKGAGSGTSKEDAELKSLRDQINNIKIETASAFVPIKVDNKIYKVYDAVTTPGTPKSDFHLIDIDGNELVWISHKDGKTAKDFQQWGGMTEKVIKNHKEVQSFIETVRTKYQGAIPRATTVARKIKDNKLKNFSVYGVDFGKQLGQQNVSILIQGPVKLVKQGKSYIFRSNHVHYNGEKMTGAFEPVLMAMYKGDRNNFGIKGARFAIQPLGSRKITEMI